MAIRFVIGRAGSGKTHHCLEAVRNRLRTDAIRGSRLIMLVPEQAALQMERDIISAIPVTHRSEVLSFQRLAYKVLETSGGGARRALSDTARTMILRHVVGRHSHELRYYRRVDRMPGFLEQLSKTVRELMQEAVEPGAFMALSVESTDSTRSAKLHDLDVIYRAYREYLGSSLLDATMSLQLARERMQRCAWLHGSEVWVDGFASFMKQELLTLIQLAQLSSRVEITLLHDPATVAKDPPSPARSIFAKTGRTYIELLRAFREAGLVVEEPLLLHEEPPHRFAASEALQHVERRLARGETLGTQFAESHGVSPSTCPNTGEHNSDNAIEIVQLATPRLEADFAVATMCRWMRERGWRFRDIAIVARDLTPYHDLLGASLSAHGVPFFIDRRRPTAHHPLAELLRSMVSLMVDDFSLESMRLALKTGLFGLSPNDGDRLENYLLAHGINGFAAWSGEDWSFSAEAESDRESKTEKQSAVDELQIINRLRCMVLKALTPWISFARVHTSTTGKSWATALADTLGSLRVHEQLRDWSQQAIAQGDADAAAEHEQIWRDLTEFLRDFALAFEEAELKVSELGEIIEAGIAQFTLGIAPPTLDQVLVGAIDRSRQPVLKGVVLVGLTDGVFPRRSAEDSILNDDDRASLIAAGTKIGAPARDQVLDEDMLFYIAVTRAREALTVTFSSADDQGRPTQRSPYVDRLLSTRPHLSIRNLHDSPDETWNVLDRSDLVRNMALALREGAQRGAICHDSQSFWLGAYERVRSTIKDDPVTSRVLSLLGKPTAAKLSGDSIRRLSGNRLRTSVSRLESFSTCPFKHFAENWLGLKERPVAEVVPLDLGRFQHAALERFIQSLIQDRKHLGSLDETEVRDRIRESCQSAASALSPAGSMTSPRNRYVMMQAARVLEGIANFQRNMASVGRFRPVAVERPFGRPEPASLPALELTTPNGRVIELRGYIDRVDITDNAVAPLAIVFDYKRTSNKRLELGEVYHGLTLQLLTYLLVVERMGATIAGRSLIPAAALFVSLARCYQSVDHPSEMTEDGEGPKSWFKPHGLIHERAAGALDQAVTGWSKWFPIFIKKDGSLGNRERSAVFSDSDFRGLLALTERRIGELSDRILDGHAEVRPYRINSQSPCEHCIMRPVCRFDMDIDEPRWLEKLSRGDVLQKLNEG